MNRMLGLVLRAVSLGLSAATVILALLGRINVGQGILLLATGQLCLAAASLERFGGK